MKTGVTVVDCIQTGMDNYKDVKITKAFDDSTTLLDIKIWIKNTLKITGKEAYNISLASYDISDIEE